MCWSSQKEVILSFLFKNKEYVLFALFEAVPEKIKPVACSLSYLGIDYFEAGAEWNLSPMGYYLVFIKLLRLGDVEVHVYCKRPGGVDPEPKAPLETGM